MRDEVVISMFRRFAVFAAAGGLALSIGSGVASAEGYDTQGASGAGRSVGVIGATKEWKFKIGLGAGLAPDYIGSDDYKFVPLPSFVASKGWTDYVLYGTTFRSNMINHPNWRLGPFVNFVPERGHVKDRPVSDADKADASLLVGAVGGYSFQIQQVPFKSSLSFMAEAGYDVLHGNGWNLTPGINWGIPISNSWNVSMAADATIASGDFMGNYFTVSGPQYRKNTRLGEPYKAGSTQLYKAGLSASTSYAFTESWGITGVVSYHRLMNDAEDSPITKRGSKHQFFTGISGTYSW